MGQFQQGSSGPSAKGGGSGKGGSNPATSGQAQFGAPNQNQTSAVQPNNPVTTPPQSAPSPTAGGGKSAMPTSIATPSTSPQGKGNSAPQGIGFANQSDNYKPATGPTNVLSGPNGIVQQSQNITPQSPQGGFDSAPSSPVLATRGGADIVPPPTMPAPVLNAPQVNGNAMGSGVQGWQTQPIAAQGAQFSGTVKTPNPFAMFNNAPQLAAPAQTGVARLDNPGQVTAFNPQAAAAEKLQSQGVPNMFGSMAPSGKGSSVLPTPAPIPQIPASTINPNLKRRFSKTMEA